MNNPQSLKRTANKLIIGGVVGFILGLLVSLLVLFPLYSKEAVQGDCAVATSTCAHSLRVASIAGKSVAVVSYISIAAVTVGLVLYIIASSKDKLSLSAAQVTPKPNPRAGWHLLISIVASIVAFFIGGSIVAFALSFLIPPADPTQDITSQIHLVTYLVIIFYPLAGALAVYFTNKWLKKKLK